MALSTKKYISPALGKASKKRVYSIHSCCVFVFTRRRGDPWLNPLKTCVHPVHLNGWPCVSGPEQRGRVKALGHVIIELLGDAAILTSEVVRIVRRCRPKKVRQSGKGNESEDG